MKNRQNKPKKHEWFPQPAKKKVYEMPEDYKTYLQNLTEMLDQSDEYKKMLPILPPETRDEALTAIRDLDQSLNAFEQKMADEYDAFQKREALIEETGKNKEEAAARLYEYLQRIFIVAKHKFDPEKFKEFEAKITAKMGKAEKAEFYELIAHRESYDLENILADPDGRVKRPMKHPQIQMNEAVFEINRIVYETPDDFKELEAQYEKVMAIRDRAERNLWLLDPEHRPKKRAQIEELDRMRDKILPQLMAYLETCIAESGKKEVENLDHEKLEAAFTRAEVASDRLHLMYKHVFPHLYKKFVETSFRDLTSEEKAEAHKRIAKREAKELDEILASAGQKTGHKKRKEKKRNR